MSPDEVGRGVPHHSEDEVSFSSSCASSKFSMPFLTLSFVDIVAVYYHDQFLLLL